MDYGDLGGYARYLRALAHPPRWCAWNGTVLETAKLLAGENAWTPVRLTDGIES